MQAGAEATQELAEVELSPHHRHNHLFDNDAPPAAKRENGSSHKCPTPSGVFRMLRAIPIPVVLIFLVELGERLTFYGTKNIFLTYTREMIGMSSGQYALIVNLFMLLNFGPLVIGAAYIADTYIGAYKTIAWGAPLRLLGSVVLLISVLPLQGWAFAKYPYDPTWARAMFHVSNVVMGLGTSAVKPVVSVLAVDQMRDTKTLAEPDEKKIETLYLWWYLSINIGSFIGQLLSPILQRLENEKNQCGHLANLPSPLCDSICGTDDLCVGTAMPSADELLHCCVGEPVGTGYWMSWTFTTGLCTLVFAIFYLGAITPGYIKMPPVGSMLAPFSTVVKSACKHFRQPKESGPVAWLSRAKGQKDIGDISDELVDKFRMALHACKVLFFLFIFWWSNLATQDYVSAMCLGVSKTDGIMDCNQIQNFNSIAIFIGIPLLDLVIYPLLRRNGRPLRALNRMGFGLIIGMLPWAFLIWIYVLVKKKGHFNGTDFDSWQPNSPGDHVSIWLFAIPYFIGGFSEIFAIVTSMEWVYSATPPGFKSLVMALNIATILFGYSIPGFIVNPFFTVKTSIYVYAVSLGVHIVHLPLFALFKSSYKNGRDLRPDLYVGSAEAVITKNDSSATAAAREEATSPSGDSDPAILVGVSLFANEMTGSVQHDNEVSV